MDWKDLASVIGKAAPLLGTLIGGPAGPVVGGLIASALGSTNDVGGVSAALAADPDALFKLKQLESDERVKLQTLALAHADNVLLAETTRQQTEVDDRKSARQREVSAKDSWTPRTLAFSITLGFFGVLAYLLVFGKPPDGGDALLVMLGSLGTAWTGVINYYFGSSAGSDRKTELISKPKSVQGA